MECRRRTTPCALLYRYLEDRINAFQVLPTLLLVRVPGAQHQRNSCLEGAGAETCRNERLGLPACLAALQGPGEQKQRIYLREKQFNLNVKQFNSNKKKGPISLPWLRRWKFCLDRNAAVPGFHLSIAVGAP